MRIFLQFHPGVWLQKLYLKRRVIFFVVRDFWTGVFGRRDRAGAISTASGTFLGSVIETDAVVCPGPGPGPGPYCGPCPDRGPDRGHGLAMICRARRGSPLPGTCYCHQLQTAR